MSSVRYDMNKRRSKLWLAWVLFGITLLATAAMYALMGAGCRELLAGEILTERFAPFVFSISNALFGLLGVLILYRRPGHPIGWLCAIIGVLGGVHFYTWVHSACLVLPLPAMDAAAWIAYLASPLMIIPTFILLPMLFPNGHFLSLRWRLLTLVGCSLILAILATVALLPGPMIWDGMGTTSAPDNPYALPTLSAAIGPQLDIILSILLNAFSLAGILSLVLRYRRSQGEVRQQLKWIAYFFAVVFGTQILFFEVPGAFITPTVFEGIGYALVITAVFLGYPLVIGVAILRYRLYDIDIIIRRTLVYALVTGALALIYVGSIVALQQIFVAVTGQESTIAIVVSTLLIAAIFNPLRTRVQAFIDRRFYRRKYDAEAMLAHFGTVARDEVNLETLTAELLDAVDRTVQPAATSLWLRDRQR